MRPPIFIDKEKFPEGEMFIVTPSRGLQFPAAEYIKERVLKECNTEKTAVVIDGKYINNIDATVAKVLIFSISLN